jgi:hypothetical protein
VPDAGRHKYCELSWLLSERGSQSAAGLAGLTVGLNRYAEKYKRLTETETISESLPEVVLWQLVQASPKPEVPGYCLPRENWQSYLQYPGSLALELSGEIATWLKLALV